MFSSFSTFSCLHTSSKREIDIAFDFNVDFDTTNVVVQSASMTSASGEANVGTYIKACKCDNLESFKCEEISTMIVKNSTAVGVATVVPSRFFSYSGVSSLDVFGTVEMNLVGGRRRLVDDGVSPDAAFEINIEVERSGAVIPDVEWTADHVQSGGKKNGLVYSFIGGSVCLVLAF